MGMQALPLQNQALVLGQCLAPRTLALLWWGVASPVTTLASLLPGLLLEQVSESVPRAGGICLGLGTGDLEASQGFKSRST